MSPKTRPNRRRESVEIAAHRARIEREMTLIADELEQQTVLAEIRHRNELRRVGDAAVACFEMQNGGGR